VSTSDSRIAWVPVNWTMSLQSRGSVLLNGGSTSTTNPGVTAPGSCTVNSSLIAGSPVVSTSLIAIGAGNVPIRGEPGRGTPWPQAASATNTSAQTPPSNKKPCLMASYLLQKDRSDPFHRDVKSERIPSTFDSAP